SGEVELHEFLHQIDWMFFAVQGWPDEFFPNPDSGRTEGDERPGGDPCAPRRKPGEQDWFPFLKHLMLEHATDRMWRTASIRRATPNLWNVGTALRWRIAGPWPFEGGLGAGLGLALPEEKLETL